MSYYKNYDLFIDGEDWVAVNGYEGYYEVSSYGRIKSLAGRYALKDRILKQGVVRTSHTNVTLSLNAIHFRISVHRLVAIHFLPNPNNYPIVLHEDDNGFNNCVTNLKWGTQSQNIQDCHNRGRAHNNLPPPRKGKDNHMFGKKQPIYIKRQVSFTKRIISDEVISTAVTEVLLAKDSMRSIARKYKMSVSYLSQLVNKKATRLKYM